MKVELYLELIDRNHMQLTLARAKLRSQLQVIPNAEGVDGETSNQQTETDPELHHDQIQNWYLYLQA